MKTLNACTMAEPTQMKEQLNQADITLNDLEHVINRLKDRLSGYLREDAECPEEKPVSTRQFVPVAAQLNISVSRIKNAYFMISNLADTFEG